MRILLYEAGVKIVVLYEIALDVKDAIIASPPEFALLLADLGLVKAKQRQFLDDLIWESETELAHIIVIIITPIKRPL